MKKIWLAALVVAALAVAGCDNPFAPKTRTPDEDPPEPAKQATEPEIVMDNLEKAFEERDKELYETLLDERFWFTETDCAGNIEFFNDREEELAIMGGRDNSEGVLDRFRTIEYTFNIFAGDGRTRELGIERPNAFEGDPDGHPDEDWEVFRGRVEMLLLENPTDGFRVEQVMTFKLREGDDGLWRIARWIDDPVSGGGDCGFKWAGKVANESDSWGRVKSVFNR